MGVCPQPCPDQAHVLLTGHYDSGKSVEHIRNHQGTVIHPGPNHTRPSIPGYPSPNPANLALPELPKLPQAAVMGTAAWGLYEKFKVPGLLVIFPSPTQVPSFPRS